MGKGGF